MSILIRGFSTGTVSSASGGKVYAVNNLTTSPIVVIGANSARQKITFINPGTITIYVNPAIDGNGAALNPSVSSLGGSMPVYSGAYVMIEGECQGAWEAFAASGTTNPLTIMDSNI